MMLDYTENMIPLLRFQTKNNNKLLRSVSSLHGNMKAIQELNRA